MPPKKRSSKGASTSKPARRVAGTAHAGGSRWSAAAAATRAALSVTWRSATALLFVALFVGWLVGRGPLERAVASVRGGEPTVHIDWIGADGAGDVNRHYLPMAVDRMLRAELEPIVGTDPFDRASLRVARERLLGSGWFAEIGEIRRMPGNAVVIRDVAPRREAAVLVEQRDRGGREHVIDRFGVPLELPVDIEPPTALFRIFHPTAPAATITTGPRQRIDRTVPWPGGDVIAALDLLALIVERAPRASALIDGVDLGGYPARGELRLITDRGGALIWGQPVGSAEAAEVGDDRKLQHLELVLAEGDRLDRPGEFIELYREAVQVIRTPRGR